MDLNKEYAITLTGSELSYIGQLLATRAYSEVFLLIPKIQSQVDSQNEKPTDSPIEPISE